MTKKRLRLMLRYPTVFCRGAAKILLSSVRTAETILPTTVYMRECFFSLTGKNALRIRKKYNYCKHKGKPAYDEIEELRGKGRLFGISIQPIGSNETIQIASDIRDVQWVQSLTDNITELQRFDDEQLFPYVKSLLEELERVVKPSPMVM